MFKSLSGSKLGIWSAHGEGKFKLPYNENKYSIIGFNNKYLAIDNNNELNVSARNIDDSTLWEISYIDEYITINNVA